jgi:hypothetical protein
VNYDPDVFLTAEDAEDTQRTQLGLASNPRRTIEHGRHGGTRRRTDDGGEEKEEQDAWLEGLGKKKFFSLCDLRGPSAFLCDISSLGW